MGCGPILGKGVWVSFVATGGALAVLRVGLFLLFYRRIISPATWYGLWNSVFYFEDFLAVYTPLGVMHGAEYFVIWGSILVLGSFVLATPILLVGWLLLRRR